MGKLSYLDDEQRHWIDWRWGWLTNHLGAGKLRAAEVPIDPRRFVEGTGPLTEQDAQQLAERLCASMNIADRPIRLVFDYGDDLHEDPDFVEAYDQAVGDGVSLVVGFHATYLADPPRLVIGLMPALARAYLQREGALEPPPPDITILGELAAIFLGCGVVLANNEFISQQVTLGLMEYRSEACTTDLPTQQIGYALARFAYDRQDPDPAWERQLRADPRGFYKKARSALRDQPPTNPPDPPQWYTDAAQGLEPDGEDDDWAPEELALANDSDYAPPDAPVYCRGCAYQLNHLPAGDCPGCGQPFDPEDLRTVSAEKPLIASQTMKKAGAISRKVLCWSVAMFFLFAFVVAIVGCLLGPSGRTF